MVVHIKDHPQSSAAVQRRASSRTDDLYDNSIFNQTGRYSLEDQRPSHQRRGDDPVVHDTGAGIDLNEVYKYDHITNYIQAQVARQYLLSLLNSPVTPSCVQESKWTDFDNLDVNGWTLRDSRDAGLSQHDSYTHVAIAKQHA